LPAVLRCAGCGGAVSEWAARCRACGRPTDDAEEPEAAETDDPSIRDASAVAEAAAPDDTGLVGDARVGVAVEPARAGSVGGSASAGATPAPAPASGGRVGRRRRVLAVGVVVVVAGAAIGALEAVSGGVALPGGRIVSTTAAGAVVLVTANGSVTAALPTIPGTGFLVAADGRYVATGTGQEFVLRGTTLTRTGGDIPFVGPPGSWRAVDFADGDQGLVATDDLDSGFVGVEAVTFAGQRTVGLGVAESVVGDPETLGVFAVAAGGAPGSGPRPSISLTDVQIERRDAGEKPVVLARADGVVHDLGEKAGTHVVLSIIPDPEGDKIAVVVVPDGGPAAPAGIVVLSRNGGVLGSVRVADGVGRPAWSPGGTSLVYDASTPRQAALAVWRIGHRPVVHVARSVAGTAGGFGDCLWAVNGDGFLCADSSSSEARVPWLIGRPGHASLRRVFGPSLPFAWLLASGTSSP
jgi:hypothetical protein